MLKDILYFVFISAAVYILKKEVKASVKEALREFHNERANESNDSIDA